MPSKNLIRDYEISLLKIEENYAKISHSTLFNQSMTLSHQLLIVCNHEISSQKLEELHRKSGLHVL